MIEEVWLVAKSPERNRGRGSNPKEDVEDIVGLVRSGNSCNLSYAFFLEYKGLARSIIGIYLSPSTSLQKLLQYHAHLHGPHARKSTSVSASIADEQRGAVVYSIE